MASVELADVDAWWEQRSPDAERIVTSGAAAAAALASRYLAAHAAIEGATVEVAQARPDPAEIATSLRVTGPVAFKKNLRLSGSESAALRVMRERISASASRLTRNGSRGTVMGTFSQSQQIAGWRRITDGDPCPFCAMLASRGATYSRRGITFQAHDSCSCTAEPLYQREPEPASVTALRDRWEQATAGLSGRDALNAFRQSLAS